MNGRRTDLETWQSLKSGKKPEPHQRTTLADVVSAENIRQTALHGSLHEELDTIFAGNVSQQSHDCELEHGEAMGRVVWHHVGILSKVTIEELHKWAKENGDTIDSLIDLARSGKLKFGTLCHWIINALGLEHMQAWAMAEKWPEAFPDEIR